MSWSAILIVPKKYIFLSMLVIFLILNAIILANTPLLKPIMGNRQLIVFIDPGHGGIDSGTHDHGIVLEKDINLQISLYLREELLKHNIQVEMSRTKDKSLENESGLISPSRYRKDLHARKEMINKSKAAVFVSIHVNALPGRSRVKGAMLFYHKDSQEGKKLAFAIASALEEHLYQSDPFYDGTKALALPQDLFILRETKIPGVLVETGFLTNPREKASLMDEAFQRQMAVSLSKGILNYLAGK